MYLFNFPKITNIQTASVYLVRTRCRAARWRQLWPAEVCPTGRELYPPSVWMSETVTKGDYSRVSKKKTANESAAAGCNTLIRRNVAAARQLFNKPTILPWILPDWVAFCPARWRSGIPSWASQCNRLAFVHTWSAAPKKNPLTIQFNPQHHPPSW